MNYKHFREKNAKFHIFVLLSIMGGISLITIYDRKFRHNRPEEGLPKMITYISPINMVAEDNHLYFAYKSPLGMFIYRYILLLNISMIISFVIAIHFITCMYNSYRGYMFLFTAFSLFFIHMILLYFCLLECNNVFFISVFFFFYFS